MPTPVTPATIRSALDARAPWIVLLPGTYDHITVEENVSIRVDGSHDGPVFVRGGVTVKGRSQSVLLQDLICCEGGVSSVDGGANVTCRRVTAEDVRGPGFNFTGRRDLEDGSGIFLDDCRARRCDIGRMFGECSKVRCVNWWADQCFNPDDPTSTGFHGDYINDASVSEFEDVNPFISRCSGTGSRGTGTSVSGGVWWKNGGTVACGTGCTRMDGATLIDSGPLELNAAIRFSVNDLAVDNPSGPAVVFSGGCLSPWGKIVRPRLTCAQEAFRCNALRADPDRPTERHQQFSVISGQYQATGGLMSAGSVPPPWALSDFYKFFDVNPNAAIRPLRSPEDFCAQVLGKTLDQVFERQAILNVEAMRQWCRL